MALELNEIRFYCTVKIIEGKLFVSSLSERLGMLWRRGWTAERNGDLFSGTSYLSTLFTHSDSEEEAVPVGETAVGENCENCFHRGFQRFLNSHNFCCRKILRPRLIQNIINYHLFFSSALRLRVNLSLMLPIKNWTVVMKGLRRRAEELFIEYVGWWEMSVKGVCDVAMYLNTVKL